MTIYFDRLTTYENEIKELEAEIRRLEGRNKNEDDTVNKYYLLLCLERLRRCKRKETRQ